MSDYIKREDAIKIINQYIGTDPIAERVEKAIPAADVEPVRHGYWNTRSSSFSSCSVFTECSICGSSGEIYMNYCPHCGAKMDGEKQEHE